MFSTVLLNITYITANHVTIIVEEIADVYATHGSKTQVLAASIRETRQVPACFRVGADIVTLPYDLFQKCYDHTLTDSGLQKFDSDWNQLQDKLK